MKKLSALLACLLILAGCTKAPTLTLTDEETLEYGSEISSLVAEADGEVSYVIQDAEGNEISEDEIKVNEEYTILFTVTDESNKSTQAEKKITFVDTTAPTLTLKEEIIVEYAADMEMDYSKYIEAEDNYDQEIKIEVIEEGRDEIEKLGSYQLTVKATDSSGNEASLSSPVTIVDTKPPVITGTEEAYTITVGGSYDFSEQVKAVDEVDGEVEISFENEWNSKKAGEYTILAVAVDSSGNRAEAEFIFKVTAKQTASSSTSSSTGNASGSNSTKPSGTTSSSGSSTSSNNGSASSGNSGNSSGSSSSNESSTGSSGDSGSTSGNSSSSNSGSSSSGNNSGSSNSGNTSSGSSSGNESNNGNSGSSDNSDTGTTAVCPGGFDESKPCDWSVVGGVAEEYPSGFYMSFKGDNDLSACNAKGDEFIADGSAGGYTCIGVGNNTGGLWGSGMFFYSRQ